jgi:ATP-dependent protease ClpP protease subunit
MTADSDLYRLRMDRAILPALQILNRAIKENRALTTVEAGGLRLSEIERDRQWGDFVRARQSAGKRVAQWELDHLDASVQPTVRLTIADTGLPKIFLYGDIDDDTAKEFQQNLAMVPDWEDIELRIFSYGGSFHSSISMHNQIESRRGRTHGVCDSVAASGGSVVLMACDSVTMLRGSWLMLHGVQVELRGSRTADELRGVVELADRTNRTLFEIYSKRWLGSEKELRDALSTDTWLDEAASLRRGLADTISDVEAVTSRVTSRHFKFKNAPSTLALSASALRDRVHLKRRLAELTMHRAACI